MPHSRLIRPLLALGLWSAVAHADPAQAPPKHSSLDAPARPLTAQEASRARVVLIGELAHVPSLAALLRELLGSARVELEIVGAERFAPDSLFTEGAGDSVMLVVVRLRGANNARLHFRAPNGDRYLLRQLELPSGLDAVGQELLGQVIQSSVAVLLHSGDGLSRDEAAAALASDGVAEPSPLPQSALAVAPRASPAPQEPPRSSPRKRGRWAFRAGLGYSGEAAGAELPLAHGPRVELGVRSVALPGWGLKLAFQRLFAQQLRTPLVGGEVQRTDALLLLEIGLPLAPGQLGSLVLGPSLEWSRLEPRYGVMGVTLASPRTDVAPALRAEFSYELAFGQLSLGATAFAAVSLLDTHYDIVDAGARKRVATLGAVRPGGAVILSWQN